MGGVPISVVVVPAFVVLALVLGLWQRQRVARRMREDYGELPLGDLAQRLRLNIVEGDPALNLATLNLTHDYQQYAPTGGRYRRLAGDGTKLTRVRLLGEPYGHPTEFVYHLRTDVEQGVSGSTKRSWFECRLSIQVPRGFPAFEIVLRNPGRHREARPELPLPPVPFGDPALDARLVLTSSDPAVGPVLAPVAVPLPALPFVHIHGQDGMLSAIATRGAWVVALPHLVQVQAVLEQMARALAGGPVRGHP